MTEDEAKALLSTRFDVSRETIAKIEAFRALVLAEAPNQNLISAASIEEFWVRHILDSVQLVPLAGPQTMPWLDLGTGAGFPGIIVAMLVDCPVFLVESRRRRVEFLTAAVAELGLSNVAIHGGRLETLPTRPVGVISARAFAPLPKIFELAVRFSSEKTIWVLPKGKSGVAELESAQASWQGVFHVETSLSDPDSTIILAHGVKGTRAR